jgi:hypothetical protein
VLNHPHDEAERPGRRAYFRSWWVIDEHAEVAAVENFNWEAWVRRLNAGRRLAPLWTTDTHDVLLIQPGTKRTYVWTDGRRDVGSILDALVAGRSFHTQVPGAVLRFAVQGALPGSVVTPDADGSVVADVRCAAAAPLSRLELIVNGVVTNTIPAPGERGCTATVRVRLSPDVEGGVARRWWVLAAAFPATPIAQAAGHGNDPISRRGFLAFTSPVYVGDWPDPPPTACR